MAAPIGARSQEVVRVLEEPSSETLPRTSNFAFIVLQNHPRTPQSCWRVEPQCLPNAAKIIEPTSKEKGTTPCAPLALSRKEPGTGAYIDTEGPRIENKLERACGTNGWAVICP